MNSSQLSATQPQLALVKQIVTACSVLGLLIGSVVGLFAQEHEKPAQLYGAEYLIEHTETIEDVNEVFDLLYDGVKIESELVLKFYEKALSISEESSSGFEYLSTIESISLMSEMGVIKFPYNVDSIVAVMQPKMSEVSADYKSQLYNIIGNAYNTTDKAYMAIVYYLKGYELKDEIDRETIAYLLGNLGDTYVEMGDTINGIKILQKSLLNTRGIDDDIVSSYSNTYDYASLADLYTGLRQYDSAWHYQHLSTSSFVASKGYDREEELGAVYLSSRIMLLIAQKRYSDAKLSVDSMAYFSPLQSEYYAGELAFAQGKYLKAYQHFLTDDLEIDFPESVILEARVKAAAAAGLYKEAHLASSKLLYNKRRKIMGSYEAATSSNDAQRKLYEDKLRADKLQHQQQLALIQGRQRLWISVGMMLLCFVGVAYSWRRFRNSDEKKRHLEDIVDEKNQNLSELNAVLEMRVKSLKRFNHLVAHDLREPIRSISGFTSLLKKRISRGENSEEEIYYLESSIQQLEQLVLGIEALHNAEKSYKAIEYAPFKSSLKLVIGTYSELCDVTVDSSLSDEYSIDASLLQRSLNPLLRNAILFNRSEEKEIQITVGLIDNNVRIEITDNGLGIAEEFQRIIFDPFKRLNRREDFAGSGMGLAISRTVANKSGGDVRLVRSEEGVGSTFELVLPVHCKVDKGISASLETVA